MQTDNDPIHPTTQQNYAASTGVPGIADKQPGLIVSVCSIVAGVIGFAIPIFGIIASGIALWLGIKGFRIGRALNYSPSVICGIIGTALAGLAIFFWLGAILLWGSVATLVGGAAMGIPRHY